ncbi:MAG TPA: GAF domain-containing protein [Candidatus Acidoferrum sp.]|nr:GAF domain-containing protein [Candidatus Acidoferrum sp.]
MQSEYIGELKKWMATISHNAAQGEFVGLTRAVELISRNFAVQPHEVAIFTLGTDERFLQFVVPEALKVVGMIPLSSTNSLAARTAREKRAEIINHFAVVPHASVFEAVPIAEERGDPIQKIMSAPILLNQKLVGVIQVSRKGKTAAEAGPDFTHPQLRELKMIADSLSHCMPMVVRA